LKASAKQEAKFADTIMEAISASAMESRQNAEDEEILLLTTTFRANAELRRTLAGMVKDATP